MTRALIIGVTGQDGSLLANHLFKNGIEVHGTFRRGSSDKFWRINELGIREQLYYHNYNVGNELAFSEIVKQVQPDLIFSLAGESFTALSFEEPKQFMTINVESAVEQLEAIRKYAPASKAFFAGSSEIFGESEPTIRLNDKATFSPKTPYGVSKLTQYHLVKLYREKYQLNVYNGILFPHESAFRSSEFVTRKIVMGLTKRKLLSASPVQLGDVTMQRDWGRASEYVEWMHQLIVLGEPGEYVFGSGENRSVENFLLEAAMCMGVTLVGKRNSIDGTTQYIDDANGDVWAISDPSKFAANRFSYGPADPSKLESVLGHSTKTSLSQLAKEMVEQEIRRMK